jgi:glycosidase
MVDATMNYRYFRDPVMKWIAQGQGSAASFDRELAPGRFVYPPQAQQAMMNLIDSHDTVRFLTQCGGDRRRLMLAALFQMTYIGAPHIYYGDEIAMEGGGDPDCRRPFHWKWTEEPERQKVHDFYRDLITIRKESKALRRGSFQALVTEGQTYAYLRRAGEEAVLVLLNNGSQAAEVEIPLEAAEGISADAVFADLLKPATVQAEGRVLRLSAGPVSGRILRLSQP